MRELVASTAGGGGFSDRRTTETSAVQSAPSLSIPHQAAPVCRHLPSVSCTAPASPGASWLSRRSLFLCGGAASRPVSAYHLCQAEKRGAPLCLSFRYRPGCAQHKRRNCCSFPRAAAVCTLPYAVPAKDNHHCARVAALSRSDEGASEQRR